MCYGLFYLVNPHRYGGNNIETAPAVVHLLAAFFKRSPSSILSKMLNLDGSRLNSARAEPLLFAILSQAPDRFFALYRTILSFARDMGISNQAIPDYLEILNEPTVPEVLLGQDELPLDVANLLHDKSEEMTRIEATYQLGELLTERLVEQKVRLGQSLFAREVLANCAYTCVFCGFAPKSLPKRHGLLRASHIKPWAQSTANERLDLRNGLTACPIHDAAFDQGYISIDEHYKIHRSLIIQRSLIDDPGVEHYFGDFLRPSLIFPADARTLGSDYIAYHRQQIFRP